MLTYTILTKIADDTDLIWLNEFLLNNSNINITDVSGNTLLYWFSYHGNLQAIHRLIMAGADPSIPGNSLHPQLDQYLPYVIAFSRKHPETGTWLVFYTAQSKRLIEIVQGDTREILENKLITSLLYENLRGNEKNFNLLHHYLTLIDDHYISYSLRDRFKLQFLSEKKEKPTSIDSETIFLQQKNGFLTAFWSIDGEIYEKSLPEEELSDIGVVKSSKDQGQVRKIISKFNIILQDFDSKIRAVEAMQGTFFGSYLSDTSDSEEETLFSTKSVKERNGTLLEADKFSEKANRTKMIYQVKTKRANKGDLNISANDPSSLFSKAERVKIENMDDVAQTRNDLMSLNTAFRASKGNLESFLLRIQGLKTKFFIAQYRGVTYLTTRWSKPERNRHCNLDEIKLPIFSQASYKKANISLDALHNVTERDNHIKALEKASEEVANSLKTTKSIKNVHYKKTIYDNLFFLLQELYTTDYDGFHRLLQEHEHLQKLFPEGSNPFVSTGDRPYHALKYAYGIKPYLGHEHERLRPRWRKDGKAERPYSGKAYITLHPMRDYHEDGPSHVPSLNAEGKIEVNNVIVAEYESSFVALIQKDRLIKTHIAKYPSFRGPYKKIYGYKYGLTLALYEKFKAAFQQHLPHTPGNKAVKELLGEWLCAYHEVRLIDIAKTEAEKQGGVLIYRTINGFSLDLSAASLLTRQSSEEVRTKIKESRSAKKTEVNSPEIKIDEEYIARITANLSLDTQENIVRGQHKFNAAIESAALTVAVLEISQTLLDTLETEDDEEFSCLILDEEQLNIRALKRKKDYAAALKKEKQPIFYHSTESELVHHYTIADGNCALSAIALGLLYLRINGNDRFTTHKNFRMHFAQSFNIDINVFTQESFSKVINALLSPKINLDNTIIQRIIEKLSCVENVVDGTENNQINQKIVAENNRTIKPEAFESGNIKPGLQQEAIKILARQAILYQLVMAYVLRKFCASENGKIFKCEVKIKNNDAISADYELKITNKFGEYLEDDVIAFLAKKFNISIQMRTEFYFVQKFGDSNLQFILFNIGSGCADSHFELALPSNLKFLDDRLKIPNLKRSETTSSFNQATIFSKNIKPIRKVKSDSELVLMI